MVRCREGVVRRLGHVHMVVRADCSIIALLFSENLQCAVRDHFVGVHVDRSACAALDRVGNELIMVMSAHNFVRCLDNCIADRRVELADVHVRLGGCFLHQGERMDELGIYSVPGNGKILYRTHRLDAVISLFWNFQGTEKVLFDPE
ncbi:hypothetical protein D3C77_433080 [compost metagenome]